MILNKVCFSFNENKVIQNLDLILKTGEIHTILGITGAGKTLLLKLISGILPLQAGSIEKESGDISYIFQQNAFLPWLTMKRNFEIMQIPIDQKLYDLLLEFNIMEYFNYYPSELSGGTIQKFNILRAFSKNSKVILLDEPFAHLDIIQKEQLYCFLLNLWQRNKATLIMVTHDIDEALLLSNRISILSKLTKNITNTYSTEDHHINGQINIETLRKNQNYNNLFEKIYSQLKMELKE
jgi:sulfonate transport system ATP-binding protein